MYDRCVKWQMQAGPNACINKDNNVFELALFPYQTVLGIKVYVLFRNDTGNLRLIFKQHLNFGPLCLIQLCYCALC